MAPTVLSPGTTDSHPAPCGSSIVTEMKAALALAGTSIQPPLGSSNAPMSTAVHVLATIGSPVQAGMPRQVRVSAMRVGVVGWNRPRPVLLVTNRPSTSTMRSVSTDEKMSTPLPSPTGMTTRLDRTCPETSTLTAEVRPGTPHPVG